LYTHTGMAFGATKILFGVELIKFLIVKYAVAVALTYYISEDFVNIAWDSAGVTTGPVTVPFVLAVGVGCSKAVQAAEGFGILACASVWPIVSVMSMEAIRRLREWYYTHTNTHTHTHPHPHTHTHTHTHKHKLTHKHPHPHTGTTVRKTTPHTCR
jgi:hypothetical protein